MSPDPFPERIDAVKLFARKGSIKAVLPLGKLQRLRACLAGHQGQVAVDLHFDLDEEGRRLLTGSLEAQVTLTCQRCLRSIDLPLHSTLRLFVFDGEEELRTLPDAEDGVALSEGGFDLLATIEDELILSLPMVPMHPEADCNEALTALKQDNRTREHAQGQSPFAALKALKASKGESTR